MSGGSLLSSDICSFLCVWKVRESLCLFDTNFFPLSRHSFDWDKNVALGLRLEIIQIVQ